MDTRKVYLFVGLMLALLGLSLGPAGVARGTLTGFPAGHPKTPLAQRAVPPPSGGPE